MKNSRIIWRVLKRTGALKLLSGYLIVLIIIAILITIFEPSINSIPDSLWFCFSIMSTIGFGDFVAETVVGRILSVILSIYSILIIALIPGIITSYHLETVKIRPRESAEKFIDDLERLPELSRDELEDLSKRVKRFMGHGDKKSPDKPLHK